MNRHRIAVIELNDKNEQKKGNPSSGDKIKSVSAIRAHVCEK